MLGSKNNFFFQSESVLKKKRNDLIILLVTKGYSDLQTKCYTRAYDYFTLYKYAFDGATLVSDLCDIQGEKGHDCLDINAMLHDYHWVRFNCSSSIKYVNISNVIFRNEIKKMGKSNLASWTRYTGLKLATPYTFVRSLILRGRMKQWQKEGLMIDCKILC